MRSSKSSRRIAEFRFLPPCRAVLTGMRVGYSGKTPPVQGRNE
jgi:hypothetical protein